MDVLYMQSAIYLTLVKCNINPFQRPSNVYAGDVLTVISQIRAADPLLVTAIRQFTTLNDSPVVAPTTEQNPGV